MFCCCSTAPDGHQEPIQDLNGETFPGVAEAARLDESDPSFYEAGADENVSAVPAMKDGTFEVRVRSKAPNLNIDVGSTTGKHLVIVRVAREGPCGDAWTQQHPDKAISINDCILEVNGVQGAPARLTQELQQAGAKLVDGVECRLLLRRPKTATIMITPESGKKVGLDCTVLDENLLVVKTQCTDGVVAAWNKAHPEKRVSKGDVIIEVNNTANAEEMQAEIKEARSKLIITFQSHELYEDATG